MYRFHRRVATGVELQDDGRMARNMNIDGLTVMFSDQPLAPLVDFTVSLRRTNILRMNLAGKRRFWGEIDLPVIRSIHDGSFQKRHTLNRKMIEMTAVRGCEVAVGVTRRDPSSLPGVPPRAREVPDSWVVDGRTLYSCGQATGQLDSYLGLRSRDTLGVRQTPSGDIYVYRNGVGQGCLCARPQGPVWVVVELRGINEATLVQPEVQELLNDIKSESLDTADHGFRLEMLKGITFVSQISEGRSLASAHKRLIILAVRLALGVPTTSKLEEFIVGDEFRRLVKKVMNSSVSPTDVVKALTEAIHHDDVRGERLVAVGGKVLNKWLCDESGKLVVPTGPGFLLCLPPFLDACAKKVGSRGDFQQSLDKHLLPVVAGGLQRKLDNPDDCSAIILQFAIDWCLPNVVQELLKSQKINPNVTFNDRQGRNGLIVALDQYLYCTEKNEKFVEEVITSVIDCERIDLSRRDENGRSPIDCCIEICKHGKVFTGIAWLERMVNKPSLNQKQRLNTSKKTLSDLNDQKQSPINKCIHICKDPNTLDIGLELLKRISHNPNLTPVILVQCLSELTDIKPDKKSKNKYKTIFTSLASKAPINEPIDEDNGWTLGHKIGQEGNVAAMEALFDVPEYDCCRQDDVGHTALFYVCQKFPVGKAMDMVVRGVDALNVTNRAGNNLHKQYSGQGNPDPNLLDFIAKHMNTSVTTTGETEHKGPSVPTDRRPTSPDWSLVPGHGADHSTQPDFAIAPTFTGKITKTVNCKYWEMCARYLEEQNIHEVYYESKGNICFCNGCVFSRNDELYYQRGKPPKWYCLPFGWSRIGLKIPPQATALNVFSEWHVGYHGTAPDKLESILNAKDLLMPDIGFISPCFLALLQLFFLLTTTSLIFVIFIAPLLSVHGIAV